MQLVEVCFEPCNLIVNGILMQIGPSVGLRCCRNVLALLLMLCPGDTCAH
jgi:hypothetical protein